MKAFITHLLIALFWWSLNPPLTLSNYLVGLFIGFIILFLFPNIFQNDRYTKRIIAAIQFFLLFITNLLISNAKLLHTILFKKNVELSPKMIAMHLSDLTQTEILILTYYMTLIPGKTTIAIENQMLIFHTIHGQDPDTVRYMVQEKIINKIKEFTR